MRALSVRRKDLICAAPLAAGSDGSAGCASSPVTSSVQLGRPVSQPVGLCHRPYGMLARSPGKTTETLQSARLAVSTK
jgi:hypothetical protein